MSRRPFACAVPDLEWRQAIPTESVIMNVGVLIFPKVENRFTQDGNIWCSAGVSAGIDLTLAFIASVAGDDVAGKVQFAAEYFPSSKIYGNYRNDSRAPAYLNTSVYPEATAERP